MEPLRPSLNICLHALLILTSIYLAGCLEFESIEQPSSILPGELFSVLVEVAGDGPDWGENWYPIAGICLPAGWTIPGDTIEYSGAYQGSITYDLDLSLDLEDIDPAPEGYYWWVGRGPWWAVYDPGKVFAEIPIQADLQPGLYSLEYLLSIGPNHNHHKNAERSDRYIIEVVDEWTPRGLNASSEGSSVVLAWLPPQQKEGLAGYHVYRDGELLNAEPFTDSTYPDQDLPAGVYHYSVSSVYENGDEHVISYEIEAVVFSGGTGKPNAPYQITLAEQLIAVADFSDLWDKHFVLNNDIDLDPNLQGGRVFNTAVIPTFFGTFDGQGNEIQHLTIEEDRLTKDRLGLFGKLEAGGRVWNLGITDVNVTGSGSDIVAGLVAENSGELNSCYVTGKIMGDNSVGGLVGGNVGNITTSYSSGFVNGGSNVGGLVGGNGGSIISSYSNGSVNGGLRIGGLVGSNGDEGSIVSSYSTGPVIETSAYGGVAGGLVGKNDGSVRASFWDIQSSGQTASDGGAGLTTDGMMDPFMVGLNGLADDPNWVLDAGGDYPRLAWEGTPGIIIPAADLSWLAGQGTAESPYRIDTADQLILLSKASILWDRQFLLGADIDLDPALPGGQIFEQAVIPVFAGVFDGADHVISNLRIEGTRKLGLFGTLTGDAEIRNIGLINVQIDIRDYDYWCAGGLVAINNGTIISSYSTGRITGYNFGSSLGGLVGYNFGSITTSFSNVTIQGSFAVGGLVGLNDGHIRASYSKGPINGSFVVGGLVGDNVGSIVSSYSRSTVDGNHSPGDSVGGLVGSNGGSIATSYSSGWVSGRSFVGGLVGMNDESVEASFWDIQSSGQSASAGGTGMTTSEMWMAATYLSAGWDFIDETNNGTEDIWRIDEGWDYPRLWWELVREN